MENNLHLILQTTEWQVDYCGYKSLHVALCFQQNGKGYCNIIEQTRFGEVPWIFAHLLL